MGAKLAEEILRYVQDRMPELIWSSYTGVKVGKISFICHSIGGLVARQALSDPMMAPLLPMMYTFISLSTPHLGTLFPESQVVSTGLWALNKLKSCLILNELMLKDTGNSSSSSASMSTAETEKCACRLAELAAGNSLSCFSKAIIAVSSLRDFYVPYYSTRMEVNSVTLLRSSARFSAKHY